MPWYNPAVTLSHNCLFNFVVGLRTGGKTFNSTLFGLNKFLKAKESGKKWELGYIRRYKQETKKSASVFMNDIAAHGYFEGHTYRVDGDKGLVDKETFVNFFSLSTSSQLKSISYPNIELLVFDEFLIKKGSVHYLRDEVEMFLELYVTITRGRDVPVLFLANAISQTNPYFAYFNIKPNGKEFQRCKVGDGEILLHNFNAKDLQQRSMDTKFGGIIKGTKYADYAFDNEFWLDNDTFVEKRDPSSKLMFCFKYGNKNFSVWRSMSKGRVWIDSKLFPSCMYTYVFSNQEMQPNTLLASSFKSTYHFKLMATAMSTGSIRYDCADTKNIWYEIVRMVNLV